MSGVRDVICIGKGTKLLLLMFQDNACWRQGGVLGSEVVKGKAEMAVYVSEEVESLV